MPSLITLVVTTAEKDGEDDAHIIAEEDEVDDDINAGYIDKAYNDSQDDCDDQNDTYDDCNEDFNDIKYADAANDTVHDNISAGKEDRNDGFDNKYKSINNIDDHNDEGHGKTPTMTPNPFKVP